MPRGHYLSEDVKGAIWMLRAEGVSKAELAREIGMNPAGVQRLLTAQSNPELRTVVAVADALDADSGDRSALTTQ